MDKNSEKSTENRRGHYLGTEIDGQWWRRYTQDGWLARGLGEYWMDASAFYFRRYLTKAPLVIALRDIVELKSGKWHSGRWAGGAPVVKMIWIKDGQRLGSGFVLARDDVATVAFIEQSRARIAPSSASLS